MPSRTGTDISAETVVKLAEHPNIVAIKEASGKLDKINEIIRTAPENFTVLSGDDALTLPMLALGAKGVISTVANIAPKEFSQMVSSFFDGDIHTAREIHFRLLPVIRALFVEGNPVPLKFAMSQMKLCENRLRPPLMLASKTTQEIVRMALKSAKLI